MNAKTAAYIIIPILLLGGIAFASSSLGATPTYNRSTFFGAVNQTLLNSTMAQVGCQSNFTVSFLNDVISIAPSTSSQLSPYVTSVQQDTSQLQSYANAGSVSSFRSYLAGTYLPQLESIRSAWSRTLRGANLTNTTVQTLRSEINSSKATYNACSLNALKGFANEKIIAYQNAIAQYQQVVSKLNSRGVSTASLNQTLNGATAAVITPLQSAINSASNASGVRSAINNYCLFDGCQSGMDYHLAANFDSQMMAGIISKAKTLNLTGAQQANLAVAQNYLNNASSTLQTVGTSPFTGGQATQVWGNIVNASVVLRQALTSK